MTCQTAKRLGKSNWKRNYLILRYVDRTATGLDGEKICGSSWWWGEGMERCEERRTSGNLVMQWQHVSHAQTDQQTMWLVNFSKGAVLSHWGYIYIMCERIDQSLCGVLANSSITQFFPIAEDKVLIPGRSTKINCCCLRLTSPHPSTPWPALSLLLTHCHSCLSSERWGHHSSYDHIPLLPFTLPSDPDHLCPAPPQPDHLSVPPLPLLCHL